MILLVDRGNSRNKWRLISGQQCVAECIDDDAFSELSGFLSCSGKQQGSGADSVIERAFIACVAGQFVAESIVSVLKEQLGVLDCVPVSVAKQWSGFAVAYDDPDTMGVDRWLQLLALYQRASFPAIVVSLGTALTVDKINSQGQHLGGLIAPGWSMLRALVKSETAQIDIVLPDEPMPSKSVLGRSTQDCLYRGTSQLLNAFLCDVAQRHAAGCTVKLVSGGGAHYAAGLLDGFECSESLVLDGLLFFAESYDA